MKRMAHRGKRGGGGREKFEIKLPATYCVKHLGENIEIRIYFLPSSWNAKTIQSDINLDFFFNNASCFTYVIKIPVEQYQNKKNILFILNLKFIYQ